MIQKITEEQLYNIIKESVEEIINQEAMLDEGLWDNIKAGFKGAKQGFEAQKSIDADNSNRKRHWDREDLAKQANPFGPGAENTAAQEANKLYNQFKEYRDMANKLLSKRNALIKKYDLVVDKATKLCTDPTPNPHFNSSGIAGSIRQSALDIASRPGRDTRPVGRRG